VGRLQRGKGQAADKVEYLSGESSRGTRFGCKKKVTAARGTVGSVREPKQKKTKQEVGRPLNKRVG